MYIERFMIRHWLTQFHRLRSHKTCIWQAGDPGVNVLVESEGRKTDVPAQGHRAGGVPCHLGKQHPLCSTQVFNLKYFCLKTPSGIHPE